MGFDLDRIGGRRAFRNLVDEVLACGDVALSLYDRGAGARVEKKPDRSPVTEADRRVEERLRDYLAQHFPSAGFFGEETGHRDESAELQFIVDPIDGTRSFVRGLPTWTILVGLVDRGVPVVGIAYMPAAQDLFIGVKGDGADHNGRPCRVSSVASLDDALVSHGGLNQFHAQSISDRLPRLASSVYTTRGYADFDGYRQLLLGRADAMVDPDVKPYDICVPFLLVHEAGGTMTSIDGKPTFDAGSGLASNGLVHDALIELLR